MKGQYICFNKATIERTESKTHGETRDLVFHFEGNRCNAKIVALLLAYTGFF